MPTIDERLDSILEELHNSWLEDDYEYDDPNGVEAKQAIKSLIISECEKATKRLISKVPKKISMEHAIKTHSDAGAGYTIGYNFCRTEVIKMLKGSLTDKEYQDEM